MTPAALTRSDLQLLLDEARRYLAAVDAFRAEGREPAWRPEREASVGPALEPPATLVASR